MLTTVRAIGVAAVRKGIGQSEKSGVEFGSTPATGESLISHFQLLEAIVEGAPDAIFAKDAEGRFILVNSACARVLGRPRVEIYGRRMSELVDPAQARQVEFADAQILATGESAVSENTFTSGDRMRVYMTTRSPLRDAAGRVIGVLGIARDITERKKVEEALGESEAQYRLLTETMPQLVWMADAQGTLQFCNQYFRDVTGLSLQEAISRGDEPIHPEDRPAVSKKWHEAVQRGQAYEVEYRLKNALLDSYTWFSARIQPVKDKSGTVLRWIGTAVDINERKKAVLDAQKREEQLRLAQEAGQIAAWTIDFESGEAWFSTGYHELFGLDPKVPLTRELLTDFILAEDRDRVLQTFRSASSGSVRLEFRIRRGSEIRWLLSLGRRVERDGKPSTMFAAVTLDITAQKEAEEELAKQAAELARSNNDLQQFSSIASHDLQEPLRNMAICSELLNRGYRHLLDDSGKQLVDLISSGARAGQALTQALLSYARAVGPDTAPTMPVSMREAFDEALANLKSTIQESGAVITCGDLPIVKGDRIQLIQLFQNLLENAIKYRREIPPVIDVNCTRRGSEWQISVRDNGVGIPESYFGRIFEPFQRLKNAKISGSGLGLATCKRIVERHGGTISVESEQGQGSTFVFTIPA
jgi:PAS domain S-box-containing protein